MAPVAMPILRPLPIECLEELMGFPADYTLKGLNSDDVRGKMLGNAVNIDVIDHLLREIVASLQADPATASRPWVFVSLFNGIDGFELGLESACEALWLIQQLITYKDGHDEGSDDDDLMGETAPLTAVQPCPL